MDRLNVVSAGADRQLEAIRQAIASFETASCLDDVLAVLRAHSERGCRADLLDLIGHSHPHGFVVLGTWLVDDSPQTAASFSHLLCPLLDQLDVRTIRLLGCSTAATERGRSAMRRISRVTRRQVLGTTRYISSHDYGASGFLSDYTLRDADRA